MHSHSVKTIWSKQEINNKNVTSRTQHQALTTQCCMLGNICMKKDNTNMKQFEVHQNPTISRTEIDKFGATVALGKIFFCAIHSKTS